MSAKKVYAIIAFCCILSNYLGVKGIGAILPIISSCNNLSKTYAPCVKIEDNKQLT